MDIKTKFTDKEVQLKDYDNENYNKESLIHVRSLNIPYEIYENHPSEKLIQKKINALPDEVKSRIKGYQLKNETAVLTRTKIARLELYDET